MIVHEWSHWLITTRKKILAGKNRVVVQLNVMTSRRYVGGGA